MLKRAAAVFSKESSGLSEAAFLLAASSLASAVLGLVRDRLFAHVFGAGKELDIYYAAFRIPDLLYVTIASFVSTTVLIPFVVKRLAPTEREKLNAFLGNTLVVFAAVMAMASAAVFAILPYIADYVAPGFDGSSQELYIRLARILLLSPFLLGLSNVLGSATQSLRKFLVFAISPIVYNIGIIAGVLFLYPTYGLAGIGWGVVIGAFLHMAIQIPVLMRSGIVPFPRGPVNRSELRDVVSLSIPRALGLGTTQVTISTVFTSLASVMQTGSIAIFQFGFNLQSVALGIIGTSYATAAFPVLAEHFARGDRASYTAEVAKTVRHILFWSLPLSALAIALRDDLIALFLGSGRFTKDDVHVTAAVFMLFSASLAAQGLLLLFTRAYYAAGETRKPVMANVASMIFVSMLAFLLVRFSSPESLMLRRFAGALGVHDLERARVLVLPLAFTVGSFFNAFLHWISFVNDFMRSGRPLALSLVRLVAAAVVAGCATVYARGLFVIPVIAGALDPFFRLAVYGSMGALFAFAAAYLLAYPEYIEVTRPLFRRFARTRIVADRAEEM